MKKTKVEKPTNEDILSLLTEFQKENQVEVFTDMDMNDSGGLDVNIDQDFVKAFEAKYPGLNIDDSLQDFFQTLIENFMVEYEKDPEAFKQFADKEVANETVKESE